MPKVSLNSITSGYGTVDALNANFDAIEAAFDNTLSRDGDTPNQMVSNLDMNGFSILNQGNPVTVEGFNWEGQWLTATTYQVGDVIQQNGSAYICVIAHTSGTFATDLAALRWQLVAQANLPTQTGNSGKYLTTNGTSASWDDVKYTPLGTGAVQRTVTGKLQEYVSVKDFNDNIQLALTAGAGKIVVISPGNYTLSSGLIVPANTYIIATGAVLNFSGAGNINALTFTNGGGIDGGEIIGPGGATYQGTGVGIYASGTNNYPLAPTFITCPRITNVIVRDFAYTGIDVLYVRNGNITNNRVYNCGYAGIQGQSLLYVNINSNTVHDIGGIGAPDSYGIAATSGEQNTTATPKSTYVSICNNVIYNILNWEAIDTHGGNDIIIAGNLLFNVRFGIMVVSLDTEAGADLLGAQRVVVSNNIIVGTGNGTNITIKGGTSEYASDIVISNNSLTNGGSPNNTSDGAIRLINVSGVNVTGNVIRRPYVNGINVIENVFFAAISGNTIIDPRDNTINSPRCIFIASNNIVCSISNNTFVFNSNASGTFVAVYSILIAGSLTGLDVAIGENNFLGISTNKLQYAASTTLGVRFAGMMAQSGQAIISLTNVAQNTLNVAFSTPFPQNAIKVFFTINGTPVPGSVQKQPILSVYSVTNTGFTISARPFDLTTFGGTGNLTVDWFATT
jgi:hypothetical protein